MEQPERPKPDKSHINIEQTSENARISQQHGVQYGNQYHYYGDTSKPSKEKGNWKKSPVVIAAIITGMVGLLTALITAGGSILAALIENSPPTSTPLLVLAATETANPSLTSSATYATTPTLTLITTATEFHSVTPRPSPTDVPVIPTPIPSTTPTLTPTNVPPTQTLLPTVTATFTSTSILPSEAGIQIVATVVFDPLTNHTKAYIPSGTYQDETGIITNAFWIDAFEVTNTQFVVFTNTHGLQGNGQSYYNPELPSSGIELTSSGRRVKPGRENYPVTGVTWYGAVAYCDWVGGHLPSALEWRKAAVWHPDNTITVYPWGNSVDFSAANIETGTLQPVGSYVAGSSIWGVYDLAGNTWEWLSDSRGTNRYMIGSAYDSSWRETSIQSSTANLPANSAASLGFRCAYPSN